jgi:CheY-like chemotaxis protein
MKEITPADSLEVISACMDLLAKRESEIKGLYDKLQMYEPPKARPKQDGDDGGIHLDGVPIATQPGWPGAIAVCGTPLIGRALMLLCPQMGLKIQGITNSGLEGLSLVERHAPAFAIVDLDVDDIDGHVLISRLKDLSPDITVLALSAGNDESTLVSAIIAGARDVISKPIQANRVIDVVKRIIKDNKNPRIIEETLPRNIDPAESLMNKGWGVV